MGLKKLSQSLLLSLAIFAGAAELRAHSAPEAKVSPNLTIATKQAPLQKKNFGFGFSAYLRHSARSLAGSFVSAVGRAQADRALALNKAGQPAKRLRSHSRATVGSKPKAQQTAIAAVCLLQQNEDLQPTHGCLHNLSLRSAQTDLCGFARLWNLTAIPPNQGQVYPHGARSLALSRPSKASIAERASLSALYNGARLRQPAVRSLSARSIMAPGLTSRRRDQAKTQAAETHLGQTVASTPRQMPLLSAAADSNGINPPLKELNLRHKAASAQPWLRLG